jgi:transcriptional regulator with XRE-family HTH domain
VAAGWTLDELAARAGASKGVVVQIEQGRANPSIATLLKVADGLGVPLTSLLEVPHVALVTVVPAGRAPSLTAGTRGRLTLLAGVEWIAGSHVELWDWSLERGGSHRSDPHRQGTREVVHVRRGALELRVAEERHRVEQGSTVHLVADIAHEYVNAGRGRLLMDMVVLEPAGSDTGVPAAQSHPAL